MGMTGILNIMAEESVLRTHLRLQFHQAVTCLNLLIFLRMNSTGPPSPEVLILYGLSPAHLTLPVLLLACSLWVTVLYGPQTCWDPFYLKTLPLLFLMPQNGPPHRIFTYLTFSCPLSLLSTVTSDGCSLATLSSRGFLTKIHSIASLYSMTLILISI